MMAECNASLERLGDIMSKRRCRSNVTKVSINDVVIRDLRPFRSTLWFEYHCWESHDSQDAQIWYRSHQQVQIVKFAQCDMVDFTTFRQRAMEGMQILYRVRFPDGLEWDVFEDELLDNPSQFTRPDPPKKLKEGLNNEKHSM